MSHHILHVLRHGCVLASERGFITCRVDEQESRLPAEDLRAVIVAARGVTLTSSFVSAVLEHDAIILHCNERYSPCGITAPLPRIIDQRAFLNQARRPPRLNAALWRRMVRGKTLNQIAVLRRQRLSSAYLNSAVEAKEIPEGHCARSYWQLYFPSIGWVSSSRDRKQDNAPNQMLNYGYAVLSALCHRSLVVHGLSPLLGVQHVTRYRADPLVYDLMEPFRPAVDLMLAKFMVGQDISMRVWCKRVGSDLREYRVRHEKFSLKLMDAIDASARSLVRSYAENIVDPFWVPELHSGAD